MTLAWMEVHNVDGKKKKAPFFRLSQGTADTEEVQVISQGNWAIAFVESEVCSGGGVGVRWGARGK